jgi:hypothetical protein
MPKIDVLGAAAVLDPNALLEVPPPNIDDPPVLVAPVLKRDPVPVPKAEVPDAGWVVLFVFVDPKRPPVAGWVVFVDVLPKREGVVEDWVVLVAVLPKILPVVPVEEPKMDFGALLSVVFVAGAVPKMDVAGEVSESQPIDTSLHYILGWVV